MNRVYIHIYFFIFTLTAISCKTLQESKSLKSMALPEKFLNNKDTSTIASINWRDYFNDTTLNNLISEALHHNLDGLIALQRIEQAKASVIYRKGLLLPNLYAGGQAAIRRYGLYTMDGAGNITTDILPGKIVPINLPDYLLGFQSQWEANITGKLQNRKKAALARYLSSIEGRNWVVSNIVIEVATAYYTLLSLDQELEIIRASIALQENAFKVVSDQKEHGVANELMVGQFQGQLLNTRSLEFEIAQQITETETALNALLGRFPQPIMRNAQLFEKDFSNTIQSGVPIQLLLNRPDIKQAELEVVAAKADLKSARAAFYPSLNISGSIGFQAFRTNLLFTTPESFVYTLVGGLWAPLLNRSAIKAEFKSANAHQLESLYQYHKTVLFAYAEVYNQLNRLNNLQKMADLKRQEASVVTKASETATELYRAGRATYLEALLTQQNKLDARLDLVVNKRNQLLTSLNLYKALGGGWR